MHRAVVDVESPDNYFQLFFDEILVDLMVEETNRYAEQNLSRNTPSPCSRFHQWAPSTKKEIKIFLGLKILMGVITKRGPYASYWSLDPVLKTPFFGNCMARNRFEILNRFIHFTNNEDRPQDCRDKLFKIRPLLENLVDKFKCFYSLGEEIAIDEAMLKWRGRVGFKVYMKNKPVKHGIKSYVLADSKTAYCWNISVYKKDKNTLLETIDNLLTPQCYGLNHCLYMDNFYNSVATSEKLLSKKIHTVGILRSSRGEPPEIRRAGRMRPQEVKAMSKRAR